MVNEAIWWVIGAGKSLTAPVRSSCSKSFSGIEYSLSHCVQVCLAKEPILAVCLSISHKFTVESFQSTFGKLWQETLPQKTRRAVDGELNEYVVFAALQVACRMNTTFPATSSVEDMLNLASYFGIYLVIAGGGKTPELTQKRTSPTCRQA
jgi:hypothetical protein